LLIIWCSLIDTFAVVLVIANCSTTQEHQGSCGLVDFQGRKDILGSKNKFFVTYETLLAATEQQNNFLLLAPSIAWPQWLQRSS
jgi:hypothetical protein